MRKFIEYEGKRSELSQITYEEFLHLRAWSGGSDSAYAAFLRELLHEQGS